MKHIGEIPVSDCYFCLAGYNLFTFQNRLELTEIKADKVIVKHTILTSKFSHFTAEKHHIVIVKALGLGLINYYLTTLYP